MGKLNASLAMVMAPAHALNVMAMAIVVNAKMVIAIATMVFREKRKMAYCEKCGQWMGWSHVFPLWWQATTDPSDDPEKFGNSWDLASGDTAGEAAKAYAETCFYRGDYPIQFTVYVREVGGEWEVFDVSVVSEPVFELSKREVEND